MSKFTCIPVNSNKVDDRFEIEADHVEYNEQTGRVTFFDDANNIVAQQSNINFFKQGSAAPTSRPAA